AVLTAAGAVVCAQPQAPEGPTKPAAREGQWMARHERFLDEAKRGGIDLLFLGDSITAGWEGHPAIWDRYYRPRIAGWPSQPAVIEKAIPRSGTATTDPGTPPTSGSAAT